MNEHIIKKLTSGQWLMTVMIIATYCVVIIGSVVLAVMGKIGVDTFLALFAGFSGLALYIAKSYFERDREKEPENGKEGVK